MTGLTSPLSLCVSAISMKTRQEWEDEGWLRQKPME